MPIRCLLVDDEHFALALLEQFVRRVPDLEWVASCRSPVRAIEILQNEPVDLLFLDIQMPVLSGLGLLRHISYKPVTIFTTAYSQHAHEAFDLDAADYLLKPFSFERFEHAVQKARELLRLRVAPAGPAGHLTVKADRKWIKIPFDEIQYIEGWKEYVKIYTNRDKIITLERLNNLEKTLPPTHFLRVHKSYIVCRERVQQLDGDALLIGQARIPVARSRKRAVVEALFP
ncbi:MAG: LytTR family DNA-binding domain-containing protein [Thermoanaerobaculia bacterium]|nr:LytTR family DNA-binding domain-containing protein [Thermoanaerobaculia bacterium]